MKDGMYLTEWAGVIQLSYVTGYEYTYVYVKNEDHSVVGLVQRRGSPASNIRPHSIPINMKRAYLLGYAEYYDKLMEYVNKA